MNHNPNECDIVQDLLPLYYDHACSPASCELVRQHLADCADCEKIYEDLANHTIDNVIETESREILERHAKKERNLAYKAGIVIAALLLVPILITFIVSMAGGSGLGVFSVVTASMMLVAALTVVPLIFFPETADEMYFMWCRCPAADFIFCKCHEWRRRIFLLVRSDCIRTFRCIFPSGDTRNDITACIIR